MLGAPQWTFLSSLFIYPIAHFASLPSKPSYRRIAQSREALSICNVTLQTALSAACLYLHKDALQTNTSHSKSTTNSSPPLIKTRSIFAQSITALEAGYLLQDSFILLHAYQRRHINASAQPPLKGWNFLHLGLHHAILGSLMLILQYYIYLEQEKGILVTVALQMMNASSIPGTLRWFAINFHPERRRLIRLLTVVYLVTFAVVRVYVPVWILQVYAKQKGPDFWAAIRGLPESCRIGSGTILLVNSLWLSQGIKRLLMGSGKVRKID